MKIWLQRISHEAEVASPLLDKGYLAIGFSGFSDRQFLQACDGEDGWQTFEQYFDDNWGERPKVRYNLWRFITEMRAADLVIVPGWGTFSVYTLIEDSARPISELELWEIKDWKGISISKTSDGLLEKTLGGRIDLGFIRKVKLLQKDIPCHGYADAALNACLKTCGTNAEISHLKESIEKTMNAFTKGQPVNPYAEIISQTSQNLLDTIKNKLQPARFGKLLKWYFQRIGASDVYIQDAQNEHDEELETEVIAVFESLKTIIHAQLRFHSGENSIWAIDKIMDFSDCIGAMDEGYTRNCWVVSCTDHFSEDAYNRAKEKHIQLIDGRQLCTMLLQVGIENLDRVE